jgi:CheY-like chemotaxis protein
MRELFAYENDAVRQRLAYCGVPSHLESVLGARDDKRILVVDDDHDVRETLAEVAESLGYVVETAEHGVAALSRLRNGPRPDLILLDVMMPVMDGFRFRKLQRQDPRLAKIPVVLVTAAGESVQGDPELGGLPLLKKPLGFQELVNALREYADGGPGKPGKS